MEAIFFQFFVKELRAALWGARVDKVYLPAPNYLTLALSMPYRPQPDATVPPVKRQFLHVRYGTGRYFCFLSAMKTSQPPRAPAEAMRLRKYLCGRRIVAVADDWPQRRLLMEFSGEGPALLLDPKAQPALVPVPEAFVGAAVWPPLDAIVAQEGIWQSHPQCSPELRRRLGALPRPEAAAILARLEAGVAEGFFVESRRGMPDAVWPVAWPESVLRGRTVARCATALEAAVAFGQPLAFGEATDREAAPDAAAKAARSRRLARSLARLDADEARMRSFIARRAEADALAANLHLLDGHKRQPSVFVPDAQGVGVTLTLDPRLTVIENMQKLYHFAAKGERGLVAIAARRRDLQDGRKSVKGPVREAGHTRREPPRVGSVSGIAAYAYRTSDGFLALRGRNAKANDQLLRQANAFDLWLHVADGPGAHVIVRRDHPGREVPQRSLLEAGGLAALSSYACGATTATVLVALVADVRRIKGAAAGRVAVDAVRETLRVRPEPELENLRESS